MRTGYIYAALAAVLTVAVTTACSDNYNSELEPMQKTLELKVDGNTSAFSKEYNAAPGNYDVNVESNTLWRVEANSIGGWISVDKVSGRGNESFTFSLRDNMLDEQRSGTVTVYMVDADGEPLNLPGSSIALTVKQNFSNVMLSPSSLEPFKPAGNDRTLFTVTANVPWTLDVSYEGEDPTEFIYITPESGDIQSVGDGTFSGGGEAEFYMSLADNRTSRDRKAYLNLKSETGSYSVEVTQNKSEYNFDVTPFENQTVGWRGDSIKFGVLSMVGWRVSSSAAWVSFTVPSYGQGSDSRVETVAVFAANDEGTERSATLRFIPDDDRYPEQDVTVIQRAWDYTFDVIPRENRIVPAEGGTIDFDVLSMVGWSVDCTASWINFSVPSSAQGSDNRIVTTATVAPNSEGFERPATVRFIPSDNRFEEISVNVTQRGYDLTFDVSRSDLPGVVMEGGGTYRISISSMFDWELAETSPWLAVTPPGGEQSDNTVTIEVKVDRNAVDMQRSGIIKIKPLKTRFKGDVDIDPGAVGISTVVIDVLQYGGQQPAISVPWVSDGIRQEEAELTFNYYSPFVAIDGAGLEWRKAGDDAWNSVPVSVTDRNSGTVTVRLTGLNAVTRYEARGYLMVGTRKLTGSATEEFTTAGRYPSDDDNPVPSR